MSGSNWSRRELLKLGLGSLASTAMLESLGQMVQVPGWHGLLTGRQLPQPHWSVGDSFELTRSLGEAGSLRQMQALLQLQAASAAYSASSPWTLVTIKIFDQVHAPLIFALGKIVNGEVATATLSDATHPATVKAGNTVAHLTSGGVKKLCRGGPGGELNRFATLRFNEWFGKRLFYGTYDGEATKSASNTFSYTNLVGKFPDDVALQTAIGLMPSPGTNHNLVMAKLRPELGDINHYAGYKNIITSPLGITAFMMGTQYDANGGENFNVVYSKINAKDDARKFEVRGRPVSTFVGNLEQSLNKGFFDERLFDKGNMANIFDKISVSAPKRRQAILNSRESLKAQIASLKALAAKESTTLLGGLDASNDSAENLANLKAAINTSLGNTQARFIPSDKSTIEVAAQQEFLVQCAYVANTLSIPDQPYRNFSLFLNLNDLDGSNLDFSKNTDVPGVLFNNLNYVEGMRQLAMGLNIIANAMSTHQKKVLVVVVTDAGRLRGMGDGNGGGIAMVMGPKGTGLLDDALHGPLNLMEQDYKDDSFIGNMGAAANNGNWTSGDSTWGLKNADGSAAADKCNMGDWQVGALQFLSEVQGLPNIPSDLGRYVKLKRKT
ncbi:hypothetical protein EBU99_10640 [bacterium]|nr:hypothetical protein [bacterium]